MSEKSMRRALDCAGEFRTARNRSVFRLQMQLWSCSITQEPYNLRDSDSKKEILISEGTTPPPRENRE